MTDFEFRWDEATVRYHVMCKPIASACNLACTYCYYLSKKDLLGQIGDARISDDVLEAYIRQNIEGQTGAEEVVFSWQGGEPTLLGLAFFERVVALEKKYARAGVRVENDLQTNGILLDDEWCRFLKENDFLVVSIFSSPKSAIPTTVSVLNSAPNLAACFSISAIRSGPLIPSGNPG